MASSSIQRRGDPGRAATRIALIEAAETLFARSGVDAVTMRELQEAAGSANKNVVAYYFDSRAALVEAIYRHRMPPMEARRVELLEDLDAAGAGQDLARLLDALYRPLLEQTDTNGRHSYSRFLAALHLRWAWTRLEVRDDFPVTEVIVERIRRLVPPTTDEHFRRRISMVFVLVANALRIGDEQQGDGALRASQLYYDAIRVGTAALAIPFGIEPIA
jgi:AcrR family transcriptional regulator